MKHSESKLNKKGFTLAELLIVVAIIGVLVAISIPIFSSQLEKAREATDAANIRSQYAEVMAESLTSGENVNGKETFGAVELKQKKDQWQNSGLKENLEGVYGQIVGDYPKAGGTAWVEFDGEKAILHYEGGSNSGGGSDSGGGSGGDSGKTTPIQKIEASADKWPTDSTRDFTSSIGEVFTYNGKIYISAADQTLKANGSPEKGGWYEWNFVSPNNTILTRENVDSSGNIKGGVKRGDIFADSDGTMYIMKINSDWQNAPSNNNENSNWIKIQTK